MTRDIKIYDFTLANHWYGFFIQADDSIAVKYQNLRTNCDTAWLTHPEITYETFGGACFAVLLHLAAVLPDEKPRVLKKPKRKPSL